MLALYGNLLREMAEREVEAVVWKNVNELPAALDGNGDIDLYVRPGSRSAFLRCLSETAFVEVRSPHRFPSIGHYYGHDAVSGKLCHLHCYFRLVTGESHLKQFVLPIERYLQGTDHRTDGRAFRELDTELQRRLAAFRRQIKVSSLPGLLLYLREREGYRAERRLLRAKAVGMPTGSRPAATGGWIDEIEERESLLQAIGGGVGLRWRLRALTRMSSAEQFLTRYATLLRRASNKLLRRRKRLAQGLIVAVVGLDGSGKSTAVDMLHDWLAADLDVRRIHYGRVAPTLLSMPLHVLLVMRRRLPGRRRAYSEEDGDPRRGGAPAGWLPHLRYVALAWERHRLLARAHRLAMSGGVVVSDRWRSVDQGKMDSPRLDPASSRGARRWMARLEQRLYRDSPQPDLLLRMRVDQRTAIQRNRDRDKPGKETDEGIAARFRVNGALSYEADRLIDIDGGLPMQVVHSLMREKFWEVVVRENAR